MHGHEVALRGSAMHISSAFKEPSELFQQTKSHALLCFAHGAAILPSRTLTIAQRTTWPRILCFACSHGGSSGRHSNRTVFRVLVRYNNSIDNHDRSVLSFDMILGRRTSGASLPLVLPSRL
jgi:hypothetical protein